MPSVAKESITSSGYPLSRRPHRFRKPRGCEIVGTDDGSGNKVKKTLHTVRLALKQQGEWCHFWVDFSIVVAVCCTWRRRGWYIAVALDGTTVSSTIKWLSVVRWTIQFLCFPGPYKILRYCPFTWQRDSAILVAVMMPLASTFACLLWQEATLSLVHHPLWIWFSRH